MEFVKYLHTLFAGSSGSSPRPAGSVVTPEGDIAEQDPTAVAKHSWAKSVVAFGISFSIHLVAAVLLSLVFLEGPRQVVANLISTLQPEELADIDPAVSTEPLNIDDIGTRSADTEVSANGSLSFAPVLGTADVKTVSIPLEPQPTTNGPAIRLQESISVPQEAPLVALLTTTGAAVTENRGGTSGAIDRITREIAASLKENRTQVMWLFDASLSLKSRREAIADQFENVYKELGALKLGAEEALTSAIASYGERTTFLTPEPTADLPQLRKLIHEIKEDESGQENVFLAVQDVVNRWNKFRMQPRRNAILIIVTDEKGDDLERLEAAIKLCRRQGVRCYVVGNAALFARAKGYVNWTYADRMQEEIPVDQGPETAALEAVQLGFWATSGRDLERMSAAYGPYGLTRLCAETGGIYFIADESRIRKFDPDIMRNYLPDYRSLQAYEADVHKNRAKLALVTASTKTAAEEIPLPRLVFRADNDAIFKQQLFEAQKPAAELEYKLNIMLEALTSGEKERSKIKEPRWQAGFDLALGRVLAMEVRSHGYNAVLAEMKTNPKPFKDARSNHWTIRPSTEITSGVQMSKMANRAQELLRKVIAEHPGTPWELLAQRELTQPLGWSWQERFFPIPPDRPPSNRPGRPQENNPPARPKPKL